MSVLLVAKALHECETIRLGARRFVFCRQRSDERLKRGAEQKSVAVLSSMPYSSVLSPLSQHAGPLYFNTGPTALQQVPEACHTCCCHSVSDMSRLIG